MYHIALMYPQHNLEAYTMVVTGWAMELEYEQIKDSLEKYFNLTISRNSYEALANLLNTQFEEAYLYM